MNTLSTIEMNKHPSMPKSKILQAMYLIYSLFYFFPLFFMGDYLATVSLLWWGGILVVFVCFVVLYFLVINGGTQQKRAIVLAAMLLLATFTSSLTPGTSAFFAYVTFFGVFFFPKKYAVLWCVATMLAILFAAGAFVDFAWYFVIPAAFASTLNIFTAGTEVHKFKMQCASERASQLEERERMAHDLHDVTGHHLTAITLKAQLAKKLLIAGQYSAVSDELDTIAELASQNRTAIRNVIEGTLPNDVAKMYSDLLDLIKEQGFEIQSTGSLPPFKADLSTEVVAIFTEGLTNALRHASEKKINIAHTLTANHYQWTIANATNGQQGRSGLGLASMARRAKNIGGSADFEVDADHAQLCLTLPLFVLERE